MNSIFIVLPILTLLMFNLGLTLRPSDFVLIARRPRAMLVGMTGQLILLPLITWALLSCFTLSPLLIIGVMLIACCPGGSSSNVFSMLAKGDVALSVSLTAVSSVLTLFTLPLIMQWTTSAVGHSIGMHLPVGNLLVQNLLTMLLPILTGIAVRQWWPRRAQSMERVLSKISFPALMLLAGIFFIQNWQTIYHNFAMLGLCIMSMLLASVSAAGVLSRLARLSSRERRTIVIEVGMQNAAQAIAIASSPFVFNDGRIATPAIIYALLMNLLLLTYVGCIMYRR